MPRSPARGRRTPSAAALWKEYRSLFPRYFWSDKTRLASVVLQGARGARLTDAQGREYIDLTSQWGTNNLGNVHPEVLRATTAALEQYGFLIYFMNPHLPMLKLARKLLRTRPSPNLTRVFLELSGTGAAEGAVKYAVETTGRPVLLSFLGQYHGLSIATGMIGALSSHERRFWEAYGGGVVHAPYPSSSPRPDGMSADEYGGWVLDFVRDRLLRHVVAPDRVAGAIFEPVALEAGVWIPPKSFLVGLRRLCDEHGWVWIDDEVEAGMGRTGRMWAVEHFGVAPDLVAIGKGLSGGLMPIAAVLGTERIMAEHDVAAGTTFGGHPAACAAASTTLDVMQRDRVVERSAALGRSALRRIREWRRFDRVVDTRGLGLCLGVELAKGDRRTPDPKTARAVFFDCVRHGTIPLYNYGDHVLRIQPSLTISAEELDRALDTIEDALRRRAS
ncbi:MAG TPA: aminotransferase class III-fold pyridoxal phosphate-dependent enzyme [Thermoplasmata archaeon]|nr:aminotransferase class III-fold pyridoxal phosphate-dependent enzyme [Thermoplasmata archaeon]